MDIRADQIPGGPWFGMAYRHSKMGDRLIWMDDSFVLEIAALDDDISVPLPAPGAHPMSPESLNLAGLLMRLWEHLVPSSPLLPGEVPVFTVSEILGCWMLRAQGTAVPLQWAELQGLDNRPEAAAGIAIAIKTGDRG